MSLGILLLVAALAASGSLLLKNGVSQIGEFSVHFSILPKIATNPSIILGLILYATSAFIWLSLLSKSDLSKLYPIFVGFDFLIVSVFSFLVFKENFNLPKILGIFLLLTGIYLISKS